MPTVEAKAKVKIRHARAIENYQKWLETRPDAPMELKFKMFSKFVDKETVKK